MFRVDRLPRNDYVTIDVAAKPDPTKADAAGTTFARGTVMPPEGEFTRGPRRAEGRPPLLTVQDVADRCGLSMKAIYRAIDRGDLRASKLCSRLRVRAEDVDAWIERSTLDRSTIPSVGIEPRPMQVGSMNGLRSMLTSPAGSAR